MTFLQPRVIAEVNTAAIRHNYQEIRKFVSKNVEIMSIVKADGYGHGAIEVAKILQDEGVNRFGVAIAKEGEELRLSGIKSPILVLGYTPITDIEMLIVNDLTQTVFSYEMAEYISTRAKRFKKVINIHVKIDTGMGRIGFLPNFSSINEIRKIMELPNINLEGIFTHFSTSDEYDKSYTKEQWSIFKGFISELKDCGVEIPLMHAANSGAIISHPYTSMDIVRPGILLYGHYPSKYLTQKNVSLIPAMSLKTQVVHVKELSPSQYVSYGKKFMTTHRTKIATIPIGYADGYSRRLSNRGRVLIRGQFADIVGTICMDQFMVDITHIPEVSVGDEVVLFGRQGDNEILVEELANIIDTINYELICMVGKRVPRRYV
ncbi:MAG: alanine racemase [Epulopiscium sp. Nele67-Bin001]|nr:MAG: alanine racemase [Epulopiscium sp. Nuni2H_MBin001]OON91872.1 MAG: alanine racemase [Epulopiscium sp. Nele67-Bin001]